jgi:hypothetical protein
MKDEVIALISATSASGKTMEFNSVDPTYEGGANSISLLQGRENYLLFGAMDKRFLSDVRKPQLDEMPDNS